MQSPTCFIPVSIDGIVHTVTIILPYTHKLSHAVQLKFSCGVFLHIFHGWFIDLYNILSAAYFIK